MSKNPKIQASMAEDQFSTIVYVVDDDEGVRITMTRLFESVGRVVEAFPSAPEFLDACPPKPTGCLITDLRMPRMSGLDLQAELNRRGVEIPIIFVTAHGDLESGIRAMKAGSIDFLQKPFNKQQLLDLAEKAIHRSIEQTGERLKLAGIRERLGSLSEQEKLVLDGIVSGEPNKRIAANLGVSIKTVEYHRAKVMKKLDARSVPDLVKTVLSAE